MREPQRRVYRRDVRLPDLRLRFEVLSKLDHPGLAKPGGQMLLTLLRLIWEPHNCLQRQLNELHLRGAGPGAVGVLRDPVLPEPGTVLQQQQELVPQLVQLQRVLHRRRLHVHQHVQGAGLQRPDHELHGDKLRANRRVLRGKLPFRAIWQRLRLRLQGVLLDLRDVLQQVNVSI